MLKTTVGLMAATALTGVCLQRDSEVPEDAMTREIQFEVRADTIDQEARTVELSFSSEEPYERWWGIEILEHSTKAVRLGRLNGGGALLMNHDTRDQVGVVEKAEIKGRKGRAVVRFGRSQHADEVFQDVVDGIRQKVSVGYRIIELVLDSSKDGLDTYRVKEWEPYEISLVSIPADTTVGVGRTSEAPTFDPRSLLDTEEEEEEDMHMRRDGTNDGPSPVPAAAAAPAPTPAEPTRELDEAAVRRSAAEDERNRISEIRAIAERLQCRELGEAAISEGDSLSDFVRNVNDQLGESRSIRTAEDAAIGMGGQERQRYSFVRLLNVLANPDSGAAREAAAFEIECSVAAQARRQQGEIRGFTVPVDMLRGPVDPNLEGRHSRDLVVGTATAGGHTVSTDLLASSFIELLRNAMAVEGLGARILTDLNGNLAIPRQTGGATAYWVAESGAPTESQQAFDQVALTPKTVGAFTDMSRKLLLQSSIDVEAFVRADLARTIGLAIDLAAINGSGASNQPTGIMQTSGIGSVVGGTNGAAPDWADIIGLETEVAVDNADIGSLAYLTNAKVRGKLKLTEKFSGTNGQPIWGDDNRLNGYGARVSNQVPSDLDKGSSTGVCSAVLFGNWNDLIIGMWSGLDLMIDPYTSSTSGTVRVVALQDCDIAVRHAQSFAAMLDALTA